MTDKYIVRKSIVETTRVLEEPNYWKITLLVTQKRSVDGVEFESKSSAVNAFDSDPDKAIAVVNNSMFAFLKQMNYDLFSEDDAKNGEDNSTEDTKS